MPEVRRRRPSSEDEAPVERPRDRARRLPEDEDKRDRDVRDRDEAVYDDADEYEPEPAPRLRRRDEEPVELGPRATTPRREGTPPPGIRAGLSGARETSRTGVGSLPRLALTPEPQLIKILGDDEPFASFAQHWVVSQEARGERRPYTCLGRGCPLCDLGDRPSKQYLFNVLLASAPDGPINKVLQIGKRAFDLFEEQATDRRSGDVDFAQDFWAVSRTGRDQRSYQTNFKLVKTDYLKKDWPEIFHPETFDTVEELEQVVEDAKRDLYGWEVVESTPRRTLDEVAKYLLDAD